MHFRDRFSSQKSLKPSCTNLYEKPPDSEQTIIALLRTISYRFPARYPTIHDLPHPWLWVTVVTVEVATHLYYLNLCPYICDFISPRVVTTRFWGPRFGETTWPPFYCLVIPLTLWPHWCYSPQKALRARRSENLLIVSMLTYHLC